MNGLYRARVAAISSLSKQQLVSLQHALDTIGIVRLTLTATSMHLYYVFSGDIFAFFNVPDTQHAILLPLMLLSTYFDNSAGLRVTYLMSHDEQAYCIITQLIRMVSMISLGIYLVITYDIYGVVIANFISRLIKLVLLTYKCRQKTSICFNRFFSWSLSSTGLIIAPMFVLPRFDYFLLALMSCFSNDAFSRCRRF